MKRIILSAAIAVMAVISATAQPRAVGARLGASGFEASYQHTLGSNFIEADLGLDYLGRPGFKAEALYNFVFARPAWTDRGTWGLYAGPGLALGYVDDIVHWKTGNPGIDNTYRNWRGHDYGFMMSVTGQIGLESAVSGHPPLLRIPCIRERIRDRFLQQRSVRIHPDCFSQIPFLNLKCRRRTEIPATDSSGQH